MTRLVLFTISSLAWANPLIAQGYAPPDPELPLPLYNQRPESGGMTTTVGGGIFGLGWKFDDSSELALGWGLSLQGIDFTYTRTVHEDEDERVSIIVGTRVGLAYEKYLGHGYSVSTELSATHTLRPLVMPMPEIGLWYYPLEGVAHYASGGRWARRAWKFLW